MTKTEKAVFAAGCFWGVEHSFSGVKGVLRTRVGYSGGNKADPTYREVCSDTTGHAEAVLVEFDPSIVGYEALVRHFFSIHDPTTVDSQGPDVGSQYRSAIFYHDEGQKAISMSVIRELTERGFYDGEIVTEVTRAGPFYEAEEYHQRYFEKNGVDLCH